ncbi:MAG: sulfotransferase family 2 domain-containing protein [Proteobacteria bacterium]|nr:sulfotransferase family 2 domain-containing protein [Pseudomonadota bacterium]MDA1285058.1 sulfotransferase family 2 domain-containing protein [Pseudomonadota bacterium]
MKIPTMLSLLSIHIPKTAGTNFSEVLKTIFQDTIHYDYGTERDLVAARAINPIITADVAKFRKDCNVVHGHFHYLKYKETFGGVPVIATLRHPVDRVVSQYRHIAMHGERSVERHRLIMDGKMGVVHFSKFPFIGNAQACYLEGIEVEDLQQAIIQEHFSQTVKDFCKKVGFDPEHPQINKLVGSPINARKGKTWKSKALPIEPEDYAKIEANCGRDLDIYNRAVEKFVG